MIEAICLHRIHDNDSDVPSVFHDINMTIQISDLLGMLSDLDATNRINNTTTLVTFDDGWRDLLLIPEDFFDKHCTLMPVIFLTDAQLTGDLTPMPLHRLYSWMQQNDVSLTDLPELQINRNNLKDLRVKDQHQLVSIVTGETQHSIDYLTPSEVSQLKANGWAVGSHGPEHCDLRLLNDDELTNLLSTTYSIVQSNNIKPWIAWPEGRWNNRIANIAKELGFERQFGLVEENRRGTDDRVVLRKLW